MDTPASIFVFFFRGGEGSFSHHFSERKKILPGVSRNVDLAWPEKKIISQQFLKYFCTKRNAWSYPKVSS